MRHFRQILRYARRTVTGGLIALWGVALTAAAATHGGASSRQLLSTAFALTVVWLIVRYPRIFFGLFFIMFVVTVLIAGPRRRRRCC